MARYIDSTGCTTVEVAIEVVDPDRDLLRVSVGTPWHGAFVDLTTEDLKTLIGHAWDESPR